MVFFRVDMACMLRPTLIGASARKSGLGISFLKRAEEGAVFGVADVGDEPGGAGGEEAKDDFLFLAVVGEGHFDGGVFAGYLRGVDDQVLGVVVLGVEQGITIDGTGLFFGRLGVFPNQGGEGRGEEFIEGGAVPGLEEGGLDLVLLVEGADDFVGSGGGGGQAGGDQECEGEKTEEVRHGARDYRKDVRRRGQRRGRR